MQPCNLLVEVFRQPIDSDVEPFLPQLQLREALVRERIGHHERRMPGSTSQIDETPLGENEYRMAVRKGIFVDLRLDGRLHSTRLFQTCHLNLVVEMADVADDGLIAHLLHVLQCDDVTITCAGNEYIALGQSTLDGLDLEALHRSLQRTDRVDFGDDDPRAVRPHRPSTSLAHITVTTDNHHLTGNHHIGGPLDAVGQRFAATVEVVELRFGT